MSTPMQQRFRLSLEDKAKIIVESKKPGFNKKQVEKKYGIGRTTIPNILKNQTQILKKLESKVYDKDGKFIGRKIIDLGASDNCSIKNKNAKYTNGSTTTEVEFLQLRGLTDILPIILNYLDNKNLSKFRLTCKQLAEMVRGEKIWRIRIISKIITYQNRLSELNSILNDINNIPAQRCILNEVDIYDCNLETLEDIAARFGQGWWQQFTMEINNLMTMNDNSYV